MGGETALPLSMCLMLGIMWPGLTSSLQPSQGWLWAPYPLVSTFQVLESQASATTHSETLPSEKRIRRESWWCMSVILSLGSLRQEAPSSRAVCTPQQVSDSKINIVKEFENVFWCPISKQIYRNRSKWEKTAWVSWLWSNCETQLHLCYWSGCVQNRIVLLKTHLSRHSIGITMTQW